MHLAVRVMLYGSDVEEAETTIPILAFFDRSIPVVGWSSGKIFGPASCARLYIAGPVAS